MTRMVRTEGPEGYLEAARHALDMLERGLVSGMSAVYESTTGVGRVSVTTIDGVEVDLPPFDLSDVREPTVPTAPAKGQK